MLIISIVFMQEKGFPGWQATIPIAATVLIIMAGKDAILNRWILSNKVLVWFGLISYPMYLWHWPLISMRRIVTLEPPSTIYCAGAFVACTVLAWLTTKLIENPLRFGQHGKAKTIGLFLVMMALGGIGYGLFNKSGLPKRFPKEIYPLQELLLRKFSDKNSGFKTPCYVEYNVDTDYKKCKNFSEDIIYSNKKVIFIWGDSQAAHLYPGFIKHFGDKYNIQYRSMSGVAPILNSGHVLAKKKNNIILNEIIDTSPWKVVIAGRWIGRNYKKLIDTIEILRDNGIKNIVIVGSPPQWKESLPKLVSRFWLSNKSFPRYLEVEKKFFDADVKLSEMADNWNVSYISLLNFLCDKNKCITTVGENSGDIVSFDHNHLTESGSEYIVGKIKENPEWMTK